MYAFRIVNVFAEDASLTGNPLAVFEDAQGLESATMQALALQFNLSETTFLLPSQRASARVRIFTPTFEMPFAGHPTLGSAHVARDVLMLGDDLLLELQAGIIPVRAAGDDWTLTANAPHWRPPQATRPELAAMLGLTEADLASDSTPLWIDTGSEQLVIPLASAEAVRRTQPDAQAMLVHARNGERALAYVFAQEGSRVLTRFFFL
ncbi:MAG: PhzF family phenazine biosynthesis protein, partial [Casimicrobiaceae bacterium]